MTKVECGMGVIGLMLDLLAGVCGPQDTAGVFPCQQGIAAGQALVCGVQTEGLGLGVGGQG